MARQPFFRGLAFPLVTLGLAAYFGYYLVYGNHGILNLARVQQEIERKQTELEQVRSDRRALEHRVSLLRPESVDPDLLEEQARSRLGLTERDEVVILKDRR
jgi:cell division protein FtsB